MWAMIAPGFLLGAFSAAVVLVCMVGCRYCIIPSTRKLTGAFIRIVENVIYCMPTVCGLPHCVSLSMKPVYG